MARRTVSIIILILILTSMLTIPFRIQPVNAIVTIFIKADGSVDPPSAPIANVGNYYYTFIADIYDSITVERDNIVLDGAGYTLEGAGTGNGISLTGRSNVTIKNMKITRFYYGIYLDSSCNYDTVSGNNITNNGYSICLRLSSNNSVSENNITTNNGHGIFLLFSSNNSVSENNITTGNGCGILFDSSCNYNSVSGNNITINNGCGVYLSYSSNYNSISGNNVTASHGYGIYLDTSSSYNSVSGNKITNMEVGIVLISSSNYNSVNGNSITNNECAIFFDMSSDNTIYHNDFIDNTAQARSIDSINIWDDGYPSGGNYWSDYTDVDLYSGPNQNELGSDGIWDHPYVIDVNNQDRYPLVNPWTSDVCGRPVLTAPLIISSEVGYVVGATLNAEFTIRNDGDAAIKLDKLGVGGRFNGGTGTLPNGLFPDFTFQTVTLQPGESHQYSGHLDLTEAGDHHFFVAYYIANPTEAEKTLLDPNNWNTCIDLAPGRTDNDRTWNRNIPGRAPAPKPIPIIGKGIWITYIWTIEGGDGNLPTIIAKLKSAGIKWVSIKCGDSNSYWLSQPSLSEWADRYGGFTEVIKRFHEAGISVLGTHFARGYNHFKDLPDATELDVANQILDIPGLDGLLINAENDTKIEAINNYRTYLEGLRSAHPNSFIAYNGWHDDQGLRSNLNNLFTEYCDVSMPETYWTVFGRSPAQEIAYMESRLGKMVQGKFVDRWHGKPIMPMGVSGPCADLGSRDILTGEIKQFCDLLFQKGYSAVSLFAYHIMPEDWKWTEYSQCFNIDTTIKGYCPIDLVATDPDGLIISKTLNEVAGTRYMEFDLSGNNSTGVEIAILHKKVGDYFIAVRPQLNASSNATYSLDISMYNLTTVLAENVSICDIPPELYAVTLTETNIVPRIAAHDIGIKRFSAFKTVLGQNQVVGFDVTVLNYGDNEEHFNFTAYANSSTIANLVNITLASRDCFSTTFQWNTTGFAKGNYTIWAYASPLQNETYTADNTLVGGSIAVTIPGDINGDFIVDIYDAILLAGTYNSVPASPTWNPNTDINGDNIVDIYDAIILANHYNQHYP